MFGLSLGELIVLLVVGLMVFGPTELPKVLRKLGQWSGKLRRYAADMRAQSGIDDVLRTEGLDQDIREIRALARGEVGGVVAAARGGLSGLSGINRFESAYAPQPVASDDPNAVAIDREREFPREGADAFGALPDTAIVYADTLPRSPLARDTVYMQGDEEQPDAAPREPEGVATAAVTDEGRA